MISSQATRLSDRLAPELTGRVCVLGIGNRLRRDDGAGSLLAAALAEQEGAAVLDAGTVPENYLEKVAGSNPDTVVIVDAIDFDGAPGEIRLLEPSATTTGRRCGVSHGSWRLS